VGEVVVMRTEEGGREVGCRYVAGGKSCSPIRPWVLPTTVPYRNVIVGTGERFVCVQTRKSASGVDENTIVIVI
jgi:hypothetical protein